MNERPSESIGSMFLDSGAHSLFNKYAHNVKDEAQKYAFYDTPEFWNFVDSYAEHVKRNLHAIDHYSNVDVIGDPVRSWKVQKYLEDEHGLDPVPVIHMGTSIKWLKRHLETGYDYIGLGGVALGADPNEYYAWADRMFNVICDTQDRTPCVKVHGFAMTAYKSLVRYPWFSVDSSSWAKAGGFGMVYFPNPQLAIRKKEFRFIPHDIADQRAIHTHQPWAINCSAKSRKADTEKSFLNLPRREREKLEEWLNLINVPIGSVDANGEMIEKGIISHHAPRKQANLHFYQALVQDLPRWPWPFKIRCRQSIL